MNETMKMVLTAVAGILLGYLMGTYGSGQYIANQTAQRDTDRDDQADLHATQVKAVIDAAADKLAGLRSERDDALAQVEALQPKVVVQGGE